ncbi:MAG: L,D-transpeptidase [Chloroflexi bacterium]|nr:L,D-transpeptidase [Chloroflexota bacterium]
MPTVSVVVPAEAAPAAEGQSPAPTATPQEARSVEAAAARDPLPSYAVSEDRLIVVDQAAQLMHVYEGGQEIRTIPCSTGIPDGYRTPAWSGEVGAYWGTFFAEGLYADDAWYLFRAQGSILIHSSPYTIENGTPVYQDLEALGRYPSSHGCIRIHPDDAQWLKRWGPAGVPVTITDWEGVQ